MRAGCGSVTTALCGPESTVFATAARAAAAAMPLSVRSCSASGARNQRAATGLGGRLRYVPRVAHLLGYAQVSTAEQSADLQVDELIAAGCWKVWTDSASGVLDRRPQLDEVLGRSELGTPYSRQRYGGSKSRPRGSGAWLPRCTAWSASHRHMATTSLSGETFTVSSTASARPPRGGRRPRPAGRAARASSQA